MIEELAYACPHCGEPVTALVDASAGSQSYIEDCEVCCRPVLLTIEVGQERIRLTAEAEQ